VRILEDEVARDAAAPIAGPFGMRFDPDKLDAWRKPMVTHLPASGGTGRPADTPTHIQVPGR